MSDVAVAGEGSEEGLLSRSTIFVYGTIGLPLAVIGYPLAIWIAPLYAGNLGVDLAIIGTMLMLSRFTDVITDPLIGEASDKWMTKYGRRKPWLAAGLPVMLLGTYMLFLPQGEVGALYFLFWLSIMFLGSTMIALPYGAWGAELSPIYHQRSRVTAVREFFTLAGLWIAAAIPVVVQYYDGGNVEIVEALNWAIFVTLPIAILLVLLFVKEPAHAARTKITLKEGLKLMARNGPFKRVMIIWFLVSSGEAFRNAVSLFFMREVIGVESTGFLYLIYFTVGLAAIPFWLWLGKQIGKHRAFVFTLVFVSFVSIANFFLDYGDYTAFTILFAVKGFCFGGLQFLPLAMLADVVDVDSARSGGKRAGAFFAMSGMVGKLAIAIGTGASLNAVAFAGFDPTPLTTNNGPTELLWLAGFYTLFTPFFFAIACWLTWNYPLTPERHQRLRALTERRNARLYGSTDSLAGE